MSDDVTKQADEILKAALEATGARDPREFYRDRLQELKQANPDGYREAVAYYRESLLPSIADVIAHERELLQVGSCCTSRSPKNLGPRVHEQSV